MSEAEKTWILKGGRWIECFFRRVLKESCEDERGRELEIALWIRKFRRPSEHEIFSRVKSKPKQKSVRLSKKSRRISDFSSFSLYFMIFLRVNLLLSL